MLVPGIASRFALSRRKPPPLPVAALGTGAVTGTLATGAVTGALATGAADGATGLIGTCGIAGAVPAGGNCSLLPSSSYVDAGSAGPRDVIKDDVCCFAHCA